MLTVAHDGEDDAEGQKGCEEDEPVQRQECGKLQVVALGDLNADVMPKSLRSRARAGRATDMRMI